MNQPPDKPRIHIVLPSKVGVLKEFRRHCALVKVLVVLILTLPAIFTSGAVALYAAHKVGLVGTQGAGAVQRAGGDAVSKTSTTSATTSSTQFVARAGL